MPEPSWRLRNQRSSCTLFDMPGLVRSLEGLYAEMWQAHQQRALPRPDLRNLDVYLEVASKGPIDAFEMQRVADYHGHWLDQLAARHRQRPIEPAARLSSSAVLAAWESTADR